MSYKPIDFESGRTLDKNREELREIRQSVLDKAKHEYMEKARRKEEAKRRGEDTWMLASVEARLDGGEKGSSKKKKKSKKHKKHKKSSKKSSRKDRSSSSESEEEVWVEKTCEPTTEKSKSSDEEPAKNLTNVDVQKMQQQWMNSVSGGFTREELRRKEGTSRIVAKQEELKRKRETDKPGSHARELNPYFKDGGAGLPKKPVETKPNPEFATAWLKKALQRAKEQAEEQGTTLEEIAAKRWGSLNNFQQLLKEADEKCSPSEQEKKESSGNEQSRATNERHRSRQDERVERKRKSSRSESSSSRSSSYERSCRKNKKKKSSRNRSSSSDSDDEYRRHKNGSRHHGRRNRRSSSREDDRSRSRSQERKRSRSKSSEHKSRDKRNKKLEMWKPSEEGSGQSSSVLKTKEKDAVWDRKGARQNHTPSWKKQTAKVVEKHHPKSSSSSSASSSDEEVKSPKNKKSVDEEKEKVPEVAMEPPSKSEAKDEIILTDKQMNDLAAKLMKAEILGNREKVDKLRNKLENARSLRDARGVVQNRPDTSNDETRQTEEILLTRTDSKGFVKPISLSNVELPERGRRNKNKKKTHGQDGKRQNYFPDDDKYSLKNMFEKEKGTTADEQNMLFEKALMTNTDKLDDDFDVDDMFVSKSALRDDSVKQQERQRQVAMKESLRNQQSLESCKWCFGNNEMKKHLMVSLGTKAYVSLPFHESLTPGHCLIVPIGHVASSTQADEDLWSEIMTFRKSLVKLFASRGEDCIFFETSMKLRYFPHMVIHCIPLPREVGDMAPIYFKKAIMECETEWSQNKKLVDLKNRDVRHAVPKGLPYFFVDFGLSPGYAHVIEDEQDFPNNFAQEIVGGVLDLEPNAWRKPKAEKFDVQRHKVLQFSNWYKDFDPNQ